MEHQIVRDAVGSPPDHPSDPRIDQAVFVPRSVDRMHPRNPEVPLQILVDEGATKPPEAPSTCTGMSQPFSFARHRGLRRCP